MRPSFATTGRWLGLAALAVGLALPAQAQRNVTLRLNTATLPDTLKTDAAIAGMELRGNVGDPGNGADTLPDGNIIDWNSGTTLRPGNIGGDYWSVSFQIPDNEALDFKFYAQQSDNQPPAGSGIGGWEDSGTGNGGNNTIAAGTGDVTVDLHYFNKTGSAQEIDWRPFEADGDSVAVWFRVYMYTEDAVTKGYDRDDGTAVVGVRGDNALGGSQNGGTSTIDWGATNIVLNRERPADVTKPGYDLFSGRVAYPASAVGQQQAYKFFFSDANTSEGWESDINGGNRLFTVPAADSTLYWQFYSNSPAVGGTPLVTAPVIFAVDITPLVAAGVFDQNSGDEMQLRGLFNGWDCPADADDCLMTRTPGTLEYVIEVPIEASPGADLPYKYYVDFEPPLSNPDFGYEEPLDQGGTNNMFTFAGTPQENGTEFFNDIRDGNVLPAGTSVAVTFRVDMGRAETFAVEPFDPATDSVFVAIEDRLWLISQGYGDDVLADGIIPGFTFSDPDGDKIYEGTLTVTGPSYNGIGYRYTYGGFEAGETLQTEGRGGTDIAGRRRYRYILPDGGGAFPATYIFAYDVFRASGPDGEFTPWEVNPTDPDGPGDLPNSIANGADDPLFGVATEPVGTDRPTALVLSRSVPNPVRSSGAVEYAVPQDGEVSLAVYDVTGRLVLTLVDGMQRAGTYRTTFDVADLPAGVYVYRLVAAGGVASGRMTVVR